MPLLVVRGAEPSEVTGKPALFCSPHSVTAFHLRATLALISYFQHHPTLLYQVFVLISSKTAVKPQPGPFKTCHVTVEEHWDLSLKSAKQRMPFEH